MYKENVKKYSILISLTFISLGLGFFAIANQAKFIGLIASTGNKKEVYSLLMSFVLCKTFSSILQVYRSNLVSYFSNKDFLKTWQQYLPIFQDEKDKSKGNEYFNTVYNLLPQVANMTLYIVILAASSAFVFGVFIYKCFDDDIYSALFLIPVLVGSSFASNHLFRNKYNEQLKNLQKNKASLMDWVGSVFSDAKSIKYNWVQSSNLEAFQQWHHSFGKSAYQAIHNHLRYVFKRSWVSNVTVDWVYFSSIGGILFLAVYQGLPLVKVIFWAGLADYLISANKDVYKMFDLYIQRKGYLDIIRENLNWTNAKRIALTAPAYPKDLSVDLLDGNHIDFSLKNRVNYIKGSNGSGKSTLSNALIGFNQEFSHWNVDEINAYGDYLRNSTRTIENNPAIYKCFDQFIDQIFGFTYQHKNYEEKKSKLSKNLNAYLNSELQQFWIQKFCDLEEKLKVRKEGRFSSGEKVIIAFFRLFSNLDDGVKTILVDECDSFLDKEVRKHFYKSVNFLSEKFMIIYVSHNFDSKTKLGSYGTYVNIVGCSREKIGFAIPVGINARYSTQGKDFFSGNLGRDLRDVFSVAKTAVMHTYPQFAFLEDLSFTVDCQKTGYTMGEVRSAGLALALGILNICSMIHDQKPIHGIAASGNILLDGSVENVLYLHEKEAAIKNMNIPLFFSPRDGRDLRSIANLAFTIS